MTARRPRRRSSRAAVLLPALAGSLLLVAGAGRPWLTGRVDDAVLGASTVTAQGDQAAPGLVAVTLVAAAAAFLVVLGDRIARMVALVVLSVSAIGLAVLVPRALVSGADVLGRAAADSAGRAGALPVGSVGVTAWAWSAVGGWTLVLLAAVAAWWGRAAADGLSARFDRPSYASAGPTATRPTAAGPTAAGPVVDEPVADTVPGDPDRAELGASASWDALSRGEDPTGPGR